MYVCIYMYMYVFICMYICIHVYIHTFIYMCIYFGDLDSACKLHMKEWDIIIIISRW